MADANDGLSVEFARLYAGDEDILEKNDGLRQRIIAACVENGRSWKEIQKIFRKEGITRKYEPSIVREARKLKGIASIGGAPGLTHTPVVDVWPDAPVSSEASSPPGFGYEDPDAGPVYKQTLKFREDGTSSARRTWVSRRPIVISKRIMHDDGSISLEISWKIANRWHNGIYNREHILDASKIVSRTAGDGLPVSSSNKDVLVEYLHAYEDHNIALIPHGYSSSAMGWQGDRGAPTKHGFLFGSKQIGANGKEIGFKGAGPGDDDDARLYETDGDFDQWKSAWSKLARFPAFKVMLYASLAAPLLAIVGAPNMIIEIVGDTSRGKTTAMQAAQSCWRSANTTFDNWFNTAVGFEAKAHLHTDMPLFIDDTKTAVEQGRGVQLAKIIYQFISGRGRGRGSRDGGQRATHNWRSILISSGEVPSSDLARSEGAAARVLSLWGTPLGDNVTSEIATLAVDVVEGSLGENFGLAGPRLVTWLHENRDTWAALKRSYLSSATRVRETFAGAAASRLAKVIALLDISSSVANEAGCLPWPWQPLLEDAGIRKLLETALQHANRAADHAAEAWRHLVSYADARPSQWIPYGSLPSSEEEPAAGWLGWVNSSNYYWYPSQLKRAIKESPFADEADVIIRKMRDRKLIDSLENRLGVGVHCTPEKKKVIWLVPLTRDEETVIADPQVSLDLGQEQDDDIPF